MTTDHAQRVRLLCPNPECGSPDLDLIESVYMTNHLSGGLIRNPDGTLDYQAFDSTTGDGGETVGVDCRRCGWTYEGDNWPDQLRAEPAID